MSGKVEPVKVLHIYVSAERIGGVVAGMSWAAGCRGAYIDGPAPREPGTAELRERKVRKARKRFGAEE